MNPYPTNAEVQTIRAPDSESTEYKHDNAVIQAILNCLLFQVLLSVAIAALIMSVRFSSENSVVLYLGLAGVCAEFGMGLFLCHCVFLFPRESPSRIVGAIGSSVIAGVQLAFITSGYGLAPLFVYVVGISITGWVMHRVFGASLSMHGVDVFQDALNTKVLLLLAPLLLILGIVPVATYFATAGGPTPPNFDFAATIVYASVVMLGVSVVPILTIYLGFLLLRLRRGWSLAAIVLLLMFVTIPMILEWIQFSRASNSVWTTVTVVSYFSGLGLAYLPFHLRGFRPVWAKRKHSSNLESAISFDDIH